MPRIGLFFGSTDYNGYEIHLIEGAICAAREAGIRLVCLDVGYAHERDGSDAKQSLLFQLVDQHNLDALVFSPTVSPRDGDRTLPEFFRPYHERGMPLISIALQVPGVPAVFCDNAIGLRQLMAHLLDDHGYRKCAFVGGPKGQQESDVRLEAFRTALKERGLDVQPDRLVHGDFSRESGFAIVQSWLERGPLGVEVIVCANDGMAFGAHLALQQAGLRVPEDIALTGFDDDPECLVLESPLTSVSQGIFDQASGAIHWAVRQVRGTPSAASMVIPSRLTIRSSCGCLEQARPTRTEARWKMVEAALGQWARGNDAQTLMKALDNVGVEDLAEVQDLCFRWSKTLRPSPDLEELSHCFTQQWSKKETKSRLRTEDQAKELILIGRRLAHSLSRETLLTSLDEVLSPAALARLGYRGLWLSLFASPQNPLVGLVPQFVSGAGTAPVGPSQPFSTGDLVPGGLSRLDERHQILLVEVLPQHDGYLGTLVFSLDQDQVKMTGAIRNLLAGAFQSVRLAEQRQAAELQMAHNARLATMGSMVAGLSHKINTPLGNAVLAASFLREKSATPGPEFDSLVELVNSSLTKVTQLVEVFRQVASLQSNLARATFDLAELVGGTMGQLQCEGGDQQPVLEVNCPVGLSMESYPEALIRIFSVLYKNALVHAFGDATMGRVWITGSGLADSGQIRLVFRDNGKGIAQESLPHIFEPFFASMKNTSGVGLDLHIVNHLVTDSLGGTIVCQSALGQGTTFTLDLPRRAPIAKTVGRTLTEGTP